MGNKPVFLIEQGEHEMFVVNLLVLVPCGYTLRIHKRLLRLLCKSIYIHKNLPLCRVIKSTGYRHKNME